MQVVRGGVAVGVRDGVVEVAARGRHAAAGRSGSVGRGRVRCGASAVGMRYVRGGVDDPAGGVASHANQVGSVRHARCQALVHGSRQPLTVAPIPESAGPPATVVFTTVCSSSRSRDRIGAALGQGALVVGDGVGARQVSRAVNS